MGRAIVRDPAVFLFDEPLSNLDAKLRVQMRTEIKELHQRLKTTTVYVTHDQIEAMTMADIIVILRDGYIEQIGAPLEVYDRPGQPLRRGVHRLARDERPARRGRGDRTARRSSRSTTLALPLPSGAAVKAGQKVVYGIRPEHLRPSATRHAGQGQRSSSRPGPKSTSMPISAAHEVCADHPGPRRDRAGRTRSASPRCWTGSICSTPRLAASLHG